MKCVLIAVVVVALCWIGKVQLGKTSRPIAAAASSSVVESESGPVVETAPPTPPPSLPETSLAAPAPFTAPEPSVALAGPAPVGSRPAWPTIPPPVVEPTKPAGPPAPLPQIILGEVLGPNNHYHDDEFGVSATYPEGWTVRGASRWGTNNSENTVSLAPDTPTSATPSMYYQMYPNGYPDLEGTEAYFRRVAQNKENQRIAGGAADYNNVPSTFEFTQIDGNPALSYYAVFTGEQGAQAELFVRILGKNGYVMFFVPGRLEDVKAIMPQIKQMASTVKVP